MPRTKYYQSRPSKRSVELGILFLGGVVVGGALMYLLDPRTGNRRRGILRDKTTSLLYRSAHVSGQVARHLRNRLEGLASITADLVRPSGVDSDVKVEARIRSVLGRTIPHPRSVSVSVERGKASVRGTLLPHEAGAVIRAIETIRGVQCVENLIVAPLDSQTAPIQ
jgi:hypothetical protein